MKARSQVSEEAVIITTPAGMKRGVAKREVDLIHREPTAQYDTIPGAATARGKIKQRRGIRVWSPTDAEQDAKSARGSGHRVV